jgi:hypothetical protein
MHIFSKMCANYVRRFINDNGSCLSFWHNIESHETNSGVETDKPCFSQQWAWSGVDIATGEELDTESK